MSACDGHFAPLPGYQSQWDIEQNALLKNKEDNYRCGAVPDSHWVPITKETQLLDGSGHRVNLRGF